MYRCLTIHVSLNDQHRVAYPGARPLARAGDGYARDCNQVSKRNQLRQRFSIRAQSSGVNSASGLLSNSSAMIRTIQVSLS